MASCLTCWTEGGTGSCSRLVPELLQDASVCAVTVPRLSISSSTLSYPLDTMIIIENFLRLLKVWRTASPTEAKNDRERGGGLVYR